MSENTVTVYSSPGCVQCNATYRAMDKKGIAFKVDDAKEADNNAMLKELGHMQAPGVIVRNSEGEIVDHWSGFRPDKVSEHAPVVQELAAA
ncbi:MAG TPA: glutaredoxin domain-containing protein [Arthrobacter sp.]